MKTKVLLISPVYPNNKGNRDEVPLGLAYLAAAVSNKNIVVEIFDMRKAKSDILKYINEYRPDFIGFQVMTHFRFLVFSLAEKIKQILPKVIIVLGGPHVYITGREILEKHIFIDYVIKGDAEISFEMVVDNSPLENIPSLVYRNKDGIIQENAIREVDINNISNPDFSKLNLSLYDYKTKQGKAFSIITSRGCSDKCIFCAAGATCSQIRFRKPEKVLAECSILKDKYGYQVLSLEDDTFGLHKKYAEEIISGLKKLKIKFAIRTRINVLNDEFLKKLKAGGCIQINFGVESGDERILKIINKNISLTKTQQVIQRCKDYDIPLNAYFMLGNYGENYDSANKTIELAIKLRKTDVNILFAFGVFIFPGTALEQIAREKGYLSAKFSWAENYYNAENLKLGYSPYVPVLETPDFKIQDILVFKNKYMNHTKQKYLNKFSKYIPSVIRSNKMLRSIYKKFI